MTNMSSTLTYYWEYPCDEAPGWWDIQEVSAVWFSSLMLDIGCSYLLRWRRIDQGGSGDDRCRWKTFNQDLLSQSMGHACHAQYGKTEFRGRADKSTEFKLCWFCSAVCGFESRSWHLYPWARHLTIIASLHPGVNGDLWGQRWFLWLI